MPTPDTRHPTLTRAPVCRVARLPEIMDINKWICFLILMCMVLFYRLMFLSTLMLKEWMTR